MYPSEQVLGHGSVERLVELVATESVELVEVKASAAAVVDIAERQPRQIVVEWSPSGPAACRVWGISPG